MSVGAQPDFIPDPGLKGRVPDAAPDFIPDQQGGQPITDTSKMSAGDRLGFWSSLSNAALGTRHPVDETVRAAKQYADKPVGTLVEATKDLAQMPYNLLRHPLEATSGPQLQQDVEDKNYAGAAGTLAGAVLPWAAPELASQAGEAVEAGKAGLAARAADQGTQAARDVFKPRTPMAEADLTHVRQQPVMQGAKTLDEATARATAEKNRIWQPYQEGLEKFGKDRIDTAGDEVAKKISSSLGPADLQRNPAAAQRVSQLAKTYTDTSFNLKELEDMRQQARSDLAQIEAKYPSQKTELMRADPEWRAVAAEKDALSGVLDREMKTRGIDAAAIRQEIGPYKGFTKLSERVMPAVPETSKGARAAGAVGGGLLGGAAGGVVGHPGLGAAAGAGAGERLADLVAPRRSATDIGVKKAFRAPLGPTSTPTGARLGTPLTEQVNNIRARRLAGIVGPDDVAAANKQRRQQQ
jgi:hypothetical protein